MVNELIKTGPEKPAVITSLADMGRYLEQIESSPALTVETTFLADGTRVVERRLSDGQSAFITMASDASWLKLEHIGYTPESTLSALASRTNNGNGGEVSIANYKSSTETFVEVVRPVDLYTYIAGLLQDVS